MLFRHAAFVPPGYTSLLFAHLYEPASCRLPTSLFAGFRRYLLEGFGLLDVQQAAAKVTAAAEGSSVGGGGSGAPLTVRLVSRRPGVGGKRMARQIGNEAELVAALEALSAEPGVGPLAVSLLDFAGRPGEPPWHQRSGMSCSARSDLAHSHALLKCDCWYPMQWRSSLRWCRAQMCC